MHFVLVQQYSIYYYLQYMHHPVDPISHNLIKPVKLKLVKLTIWYSCSSNAQKQTSWQQSTQFIIRQ